MSRNFEAIQSDLAIDDNRQRARDFIRMRRIASLLLLFVACLFLIALTFEARYPWLAYLRAFTESSMVGGCADWFAIVAMFRYPMGLKIPHTAIIPRSKDRIARTVGGFISDNFLAPAVLTARLEKIDMAGWLADWLAGPDHIEMLAAKATQVMAPVADLLGHGAVHDALRDAAQRGIAAIPISPLAAQGLTVLQRNGAMMAIAEWLLDQGDQALTRHSDAIRAQIGKNSGRWVPKWMDDKLADRIIGGFHNSLAEMKAPDHGWRTGFGDWLAKVIERLKHDPSMLEAGEGLKQDLVSNPIITEQLDRLWEGIEANLRSGEPGGSPVQVGLERGLRALAELLARDEALRASVNEGARSAIKGILAPNRDRIGDYIADVVNEWDDSVLVGKVELQMGKDLQYVRVNGTLVGGLVGLLIFLFARLVTGAGLPG